MEVNDITSIQDPDVPTIDVKIDGILILGFQVDIGSSVSLMSTETIKELGLTNMVPTSVMLIWKIKHVPKPYVNYFKLLLVDNINLISLYFKPLMFINLYMVYWATVVNSS